MMNKNDFFKVSPATLSDMAKKMAYVWTSNKANEIERERISTIIYRYVFLDRDLYKNNIEDLIRSYRRTSSQGWEIEPASEYPVNKGKNTIVRAVLQEAGVQPNEVMEWRLAHGYEIDAATKANLIQSAPNKIEALLEKIVKEQKVANEIQTQCYSGIIEMLDNLIKMVAGIETRLAQIEPTVRKSPRVDPISIRNSISRSPLLDDNSMPNKTKSEV